MNRVTINLAAAGCIGGRLFEAEDVPGYDNGTIVRRVRDATRAE